MLLTVTTEWRAVICLTCTLVQENVCCAVGSYSFILLLVSIIRLRSLYQLQMIGFVCLPENKFTWRVISHRKNRVVFLTRLWLAPRDCHDSSSGANWWRPQIQRWSRSDSSFDLLTDNTENELLWRDNRKLHHDLSDVSIIGGVMWISNGKQHSQILKVKLFYACLEGMWGGGVDL